MQAHKRLRLKPVWLYREYLKRKSFEIISTIQFYYPLILDNKVTIISSKMEYTRVKGEHKKYRSDHITENDKKKKGG